MQVKEMTDDIVLPGIVKSRKASPLHPQHPMLQYIRCLLWVQGVVWRHQPFPSKMPDYARQLDDTNSRVFDSGVFEPLGDEQTDTTVLMPWKQNVML